MDTIFVNSKNSKTSYPYRLLLNLADKTNLKRSNKYVALNMLSQHALHMEKYKNIIEEQ